MDPDRQRVDKWLWFARVVKTRSLASRLVCEGHVRVNGTRATSPSKGVGIGDVLTISLERTVRVLRVADTGQRRGPFKDARLLFEDLGDDAPMSRACVAATKRLASADASAPPQTGPERPEGSSL